MNNGLFGLPLTPAAEAVALLAKTQYRVFGVSGTFVVSRKGKLLIFSLAGGGSGASLVRPSGAHSALGGGGGEACYDLVDVEAGDIFTVSIGAGGASVSTSGGAASANGNDGGTTTISGPRGYLTTVLGGKGGFKVDSGAAQSGAPGGTGGEGRRDTAFRCPGFRGGAVVGVGTALRCTGGGAANPFGLPGDVGRGGDCSHTGTGNAGTGGGGVGGRGADVATNTVNAAGGGSGGDAVGSVAGPNVFGEAGATPVGIVAAMSALGLDFFGGGAVSGGNSSFPGGGGSATAGAANQNNGALFGGSGAIAANSLTLAAGQTAGRGGGGGGAGSIAGSGPINSPKGGDGLAVFIEFGEL